MNSTYRATEICFSCAAGVHAACPVRVGTYRTCKCPICDSRMGSLRNVYPGLAYRMWEIRKADGAVPAEVIQSVRSALTSQPGLTAAQVEDLVSLALRASDGVRWTLREFTEQRVLLDVSKSQWVASWVAPTA